MVRLSRVGTVFFLLANLLVLSACSESRSGPAWTCAAQANDPAAQSDQGPIKPLPCQIQVKGKDLLARLENKNEKWYLFVSHPKGGQVKAELTITPRWGDAVVIQAKPRTPDCNRKDCIFPLPPEVFKLFKKSQSISVKLTRAIVVPHRINHEKYSEEFTNRGLSEALKDAGY